jgi:hypothetical protein
MEVIPKSGLFFPDRVALIAFKALDDVLGANGVHALFNYAHLSQYIDHMPASDLAKTIDFADISSLFGGLEDLYGPRGSRGLALRTGRQMFKQSLSIPDTLPGMSDQSLQPIPEFDRIPYVLKGICETFRTISDQPMLFAEKEDSFEITIQRCGVCWGRKTDHAVCAMFTGFFQQALTWAAGGQEYPVEETQCIGQGDDVCLWSIGKKPMDM